MPSIGLEAKKNMIKTTRVFPSMASRVANVIVHLYSAKTTATPPKLRMSPLQWRRILRHWVFFLGVGCWSAWFHGANGVYIGFDYTLSLIEYPACWTHGNGNHTIYNECSLPFPSWSSTGELTRSRDSPPLQYYRPTGDLGGAAAVSQ